MWVVENVNGDGSIVRKEFEKYGDAKSYSEWTLGSVRYISDLDLTSVLQDNGYKIVRQD